MQENAMHETEPKYFTEFREYIDKKFSEVKTDIYISETRLGDRIDKLSTEVGKIEKLVGKYEVRAQNIEDILLKDHKPRIAELEKTVFN